MEILTSLYYLFQKLSDYFPWMKLFCSACWSTKPLRMTKFTETPHCNSLKKEKIGFSYIHRNTKEPLEFGFLQQCCNLLGLLLTEALITNRTIPKSEQADGLCLPQLYMNKRIHRSWREAVCELFQHQDVWVQVSIPAPSQPFPVDLAPRQPPALTVVRGVQGDHGDGHDGQQHHHHCQPHLQPAPATSLLWFGGVHLSYIHLAFRLAHNPASAREKGIFTEHSPWLIGFKPAPRLHSDKGVF